MNERPTARLRLQGIRARGRHGVRPDERAEAQEFAVDVEASVEVTEDTIERTVDYRRIAEAVRGTVEGTSFQLLESLAEAVASAVLGLGTVRGVTVTVHKPGAARSMKAEDVAASVSLER